MTMRKTKGPVVGPKGGTGTPPLPRSVLAGECRGCGIRDLAGSPLAVKLELPDYITESDAYWKSLEQAVNCRATVTCTHRGRTWVIHRESLVGLAVAEGCGDEPAIVNGGVR